MLCVKMLQNKELCYSSLCCCGSTSFIFWWKCSVSSSDWSDLSPSPHQFSSPSSPPRFQFPSWQPENRTLSSHSHSSCSTHFQSSFSVFSPHLPISCSRSAEDVTDSMTLHQHGDSRGWWENDTKTSPERKESIFWFWMWWEMECVWHHQKWTKDGFILWLRGWIEVKWFQFVFSV